MAYARHQSFFIKDNWINKGIKAILQDPKVFNETSNYIYLGIGKNMFISLKYWLEAFNIIDFSNENAVLTNFGLYINEVDLSCKEMLTLNLLHYFLTLEKPINGVEQSTAFYWFFNINKDSIFKKSDLLSELINWDTKSNKKSTSENTLSRDIDCLLQTYTRLEKLHPEDKNTSILAKMNLVSKNKDYFTKNKINTKYIDRDFFMYAILRLWEDTASDSKYLDLNTVDETPMSPSKIFNISRVETINLIEELILKEYPLQIVRTNNLNTISISFATESSVYLDNLLKRRRGISK